ncbi:hypothetical protein EU546_07000 [Candidatus Thorarchaeota archaeon]|nr:MAG: hypothetical protein EU546_07000 [Candidatus Thorarchaeota archaeon]
MKQTYVFAVLVLFVSGFLFVPDVTSNETSMTADGFVQDSTVLSGQVPRTIRVAVYDEPNATLPDYGAAGLTSTNITPLLLMLEGAGYDVTPLTFQNILNHELKAASYDVFVIFDNNPRENTSELVKQYWLGGGGILSIDGAINYITYFGIMCPDLEGTNDYGSDWDYVWSENHTIENRHPVTKAFEVGDKITNYLDWGAFNKTMLEFSSTSTEYTMLTSPDADPSWVNTLARDPELQGGRVVHAFGDDRDDYLPDESIIVEAVDWLAMRPKGRILFDLTNEPYYGVDPGDPSGYNLEGRHAAMRDYLVRNRFTFDKAYPDDGPLEISFLRQYDMLFINTPGLSYSTPEIDAIHQWVEEGGGLLLHGEYQSFSDQNANLREILSAYDMNITDTDYSPSTLITTNATVHPVNAFAASMEFLGGAFVESWGDAFTLWGDGAGNETIVAQEIGMGRVVLCGDINYLGNYIDYEDNAQFAENVANWLCSGGAEVLLYTDGKTSIGPDYNYYRSPAALALNELAVEYFMTNDRDMFNESLKMQTWELVIIDANNDAPATSHNLIIDHLEAGGKLIWRDFMFRYDFAPYNSTWSYLGWQGLGSTITGGPPDVFLWEPDHPVFNMPVEYGEATIESLNNLFMTDYTYVHLYDNATALAGITPTFDSNESAIVLGVEGRALCNMFAISQYVDDTDDSTYSDAYELFINEIAFMLRPTIDHPGDVEFEEGETGNSIVWNPESLYPARYVIYQNGSDIVDIAWFGEQVVLDLDYLTNGTYIFEILVYDRAGYSVLDEVQVDVLVPEIPTTTGELPILLIIAAAAAVVIIIVVVIVVQRRSKS